MTGADAATSEHVRTTLFPSLGFFGASACDALSVPLDAPVSRILLQVPEGVTAALDLVGLDLTDSGTVVPIPPDARHLRQSRYPAEQDHDPDPFARQGVRTPLDRDAWWLVRFDEPVTADLLRVFNRSDRYGYRTRQLVVRVAPPHGDWRTVATVGGCDDVDRLATLVERLTGLDVRPDMVDVDQAAARRTEMMRELARRAVREPLSDSTDDVRRLLALVPTGHGRDRPRLTDEERTVLAHLLVAQFALTERTPSSVASFGFALGTPAELERLGTEINRVAPVLGTPPLVITRHGLRVEGALQLRGEEYLTLIDRARADFDDLGFPLMLGYGTLLGAVREGDFLAHDDDVDLLFPIVAKGRSQARPQIDDLCERLRRRGWKIWRNHRIRALNFHLIDRQTNRRLDVFPVLLRKRRARLHMQQMKLRKIPRDVVLPPRTLEFRDHVVEVPQDPEGFLAARYGSSWDVSDPYHDWLWPLSEEDADGATTLLSSAASAR